ncbi:Signal transduction histidine kinase [Desulfonispora thiosulfatigenes DSM 11270]|uniref:histidine kinase n=1 Tax=Desulfonispora thiosulfatigenes DSM 11270 TaxID=656914 RepID=A0A1W1V3N2_DESTI|nr:HAMP domain-containing sensor histidine kinase [Desulfonispora thiosulfatigenes]SMB87908.1 Signal transduction histidine kinase [Desulfonispora thiosulfatigenes DSM 11270]
MVTKLKSKLPLIAVLLLFTFGLNGLFFLTSSNHQYFKDNYFETREFAGTYEEFINQLSVYELNYQPPEEIKKEIKVTSAEIEEHRFRYGDLGTQVQDLKSQYEDKIREATDNNNPELVKIYTTERDAKIKDITQNFTDDEHVRVKVIGEKEEKIDKYYQELDQRRAEFNSSKEGFTYYLTDTATGEVYTNLPQKEIKEVNNILSQENTIFVKNYVKTGENVLVAKADHRFEYSDLINELKNPMNKRFSGKIAVMKASAENNSLVANYKNYQKTQYFAYLLLACALLALVSSIYLTRKLKIIENSNNGLENLRTTYERLPLDVRVVSFIVTGIIALGYLKQDYFFYYYNYIWEFIRVTIFYLIQAGFFVGATLVQGKLLWDKLNDYASLEDEWQGSLTLKTYQAVKEAFLIRSIGFRVIIILTIVFALGVGAIAVLMEPEMIIIYLPFLVIVGLPMFIIIFKRTGYFNKILINTEELVKGNLEPDIEVKGKSELATLANNINTLKFGVKVSKREQVKSERLKTELITNVSHDLRTPLTSIINYTELLKDENLAEEEKKAYVEIIDRKSQRLKVLIDDLFEASKMASGNIDLNKEKVDLVQLLQQSLAEHNEAIGKSSLNFKVKMPEVPLYAQVDGQKLWRVFDNLITNILKYALENTRVYITLENIHNKVIISFKNITKYELSENIDELFERFKRGDSSRNTEGSGLGLAISKSILELHEGNLDIEVDGDLFKITLTLDPTLN